MTWVDVVWASGLFIGTIALGHAIFSYLTYVTKAERHNDRHDWRVHSVSVCDTAPPHVLYNGCTYVDGQNLPQPKQLEKVLRYAERLIPGINVLRDYVEYVRIVVTIQGQRKVLYFEGAPMLHTVLCYVLDESVKPRLTNKYDDDVLMQKLSIYRIDLRGVYKNYRPVLDRMLSPRGTVWYGTNGKITYDFTLYSVIREMFHEDHGALCEPMTIPKSYIDQERLEVNFFHPTIPWYTQNVDPSTKWSIDPDMFFTVFLDEHTPKGSVYIPPPKMLPALETVKEDGDSDTDDDSEVEERQVALEQHPTRAQDE